MLKLTHLSFTIVIIIFQLTFQHSKCWILPYEHHDILSNSSALTSASSASSSSLLWTLPSQPSPPLNQLASASVESIFNLSTSSVKKSLLITGREEKKRKGEILLLHHRYKRSDQEQSANEPKEIKILAGQSVKIHCRLQQVTGRLTLTVESPSDSSSSSESGKNQVLYTFLEEVYWFKGKFKWLIAVILRSSNGDNFLWNLDVKRLPVNKRQEVCENGTLVLRDLVKPDDAGIYTCTTSPTLSMTSETSESTRSDLMQRSIRINVLRKYHQNKLILKSHLTHKIDKTY